MIGIQPVITLESHPRPVCVGGGRSNAWDQVTPKPTLHCSFIATHDIKTVASSNISDKICDKNFLSQYPRILFTTIDMLYRYAKKSFWVRNNLHVYSKDIHLTITMCIKT